MKNEALAHGTQGNQLHANPRDSGQAALSPSEEADCCEALSQVLVAADHWLMRRVPMAARSG